MKRDPAWMFLQDAGRIDEQNCNWWKYLFWWFRNPNRELPSFIYSTNTLAIRRKRLNFYRHNNPLELAETINTLSWYT